MNTRIRFATLSTACALTLAAGLAQAQVTIDQNKALAGNITAGDSAGFPITITQSGSYKLTGNLMVPAGAKGIVVTAPQVTIDMNGFSLIGPSTCTRDIGTKAVACSYADGTTHGIDASAGSGTAVRNGTVKGFAGHGILAGTMDRYETLRLTENSFGLATTSRSQSISSCTVDTNGNSGIVALYALITNCRVVFNGGDGIAGSSGTVVNASDVSSNRLIGLSHVVARGTHLESNGTNRVGGFSMGGNLDNITAF